MAMADIVDAVALTLKPEGMGGRGMQCAVGKRGMF